MNQPSHHEKHHQPFQADKSKVNYLQRCFYVINLLKDKDHDLWENFHAQYCVTKPEESWELFQMVVEEYRKLCAPPKVRHIKSKAPKKSAAAKKKPATRIAAKKPARKKAA